MIQFIGKRLLLAVPTIILVTFFVFALMELSPTDPAAALAGDNPTPERLAELHHQLGLDRPFLTRYLEWGGNALQGDLGISPVTHQSVISDLMFRLPITASLVLLAMIFALVLGVGLGTIAALNKGGVLDWLTNSFANLLLAVPPFVAAVLLVLFLAIMSPMFPATGYANMSAGIGPWLQFSTLPALSLAIIPAALLTRQVRGALIDALEEDYIRTARAKGLRRRMVVGKHAAKNAAVPVVTVLGLVFTSMFGGAVVVERIFAIPGLGSVSVESVLNGDLITLQGLVLLVAVLVTVVNLVIDASYGYFNPRLRIR
ncbi:ABC transporter permease [Nocardioides sp. JQ2195]|uniref:ABC transporter permease n=1 Tax=Nocardioides sp. JQ2195 TaxID=2592334 RepID=UPI00143EB2F8|nr:ABC transporter permease [Nocardioides sp. JQ2195]QIX26542.1 ABC transporter permease [Nocardioides sp. JQ2195]